MNVILKKWFVFIGIILGFVDFVEARMLYPIPFAEEIESMPLSVLVAKDYPQCKVKGFDLEDWDVEKEILIYD
jgi:hypothetical protein